MKTRSMLTTIALILVAGFVMAGEESKPVRVSTVENTTDSALPELSEIVDLCASDEEEKFKMEWSNYVAQNDLKGDELQKTIAWVSDEAAIQRKKHKHMNGDDGDDEAWKEERQKLMNEFARAARLR